MPNADWKKCAVCMALPTTQTSASQPETGNGSVEASYSTRPTSCSSWSQVEAGEALLVVEGLFEAHDVLLGGRRRAQAHPPRPAAQAAPARAGHVCTIGLPIGRFSCADCISMAHRAGRPGRRPARRAARAPAGRGAGALPAHRRRPGHGVRPAAAAGGRRRDHRLRPRRRRRRRRLRRPGVRDAGDRPGRAGRRAAPTSTAIPGLLEAHATTGSGDVLCRVAASSHEALQQVLVDLNRSPAVVRSTSVVALSTLVPWRTLPLLRAAAAPGAGRARPTPGA